jgi:hypothetical protein
MPDIDLVATVVPAGAPACAEPFPADAAPEVLEEHAATTSPASAVMATSVRGRVIARLDLLKAIAIPAAFLLVLVR